MNEIKPRLRRIRDYVNGKRGKRLLVLFRSSDGTEMIGNADDLITPVSYTHLPTIVNTSTEHSMMSPFLMSRFLFLP